MRPRLKTISVGDQFGNLTVLKEGKPDSRSIARYECLCECGNMVLLRAGHLTSDRRFCSRSCSLLSKYRSTDLVGQSFGFWKVIASSSSPVGERGRFWICRCKCGAEKVHRGTALKAGQTMKCRKCASLDRRLELTPEERLELRRKISRESARRYPARRKANKIKYERKRSKATPAWLTPEQWEAMNNLYLEAKMLTKITGIRHEVDHVHPLNGVGLCGLHVPWNLQVLTQVENVAKSNIYAELSGD